VSRRWSGSDRVRGHCNTAPLGEEETGAGPTVAIGTAVDRLLRQRGMEDALVLGRVASCWEEVVGPEVARQVRPQFVRDGELVVSVDHPAWATELELAGSAVLGRLFEQLGDVAPKRLSVRVVPASRR
jgi:predicted nucleic acid-binding Zn ribbon protein